MTKQTKLIDGETYYTPRYIATHRLIQVPSKQFLNAEPGEYSARSIEAFIRRLIATERIDYVLRGRYYLISQGAIDKYNGRSK